MRVLVCGSRDWDDPIPIQNALAQLPRGSTVIHGGSRGADQIAGCIATKMGFKVECYPAEWRKYGRGAGPMRNYVMLSTKPEMVFAFQLNRSTGTQHMINIARAANVPVTVR